MHPDFTTLRLFLTVAEERSIGKAAEREHITAPAISKRIIDLEQSLGVTLFERQNVGVTLTPAGTALVAEARAVLLSLDRMKGKLSEYADGQQGQVRILFSPSGQVGKLPESLHAFMGGQPLIQVHLGEKPSLQVVYDVVQGEADIGIFARLPATTDAAEAGNLKVHPYQVLRLAVVVRHDHPLAAERRVAFRDAVEYDFVGFAESSSVGALLRKISQEQGLKFNTRLQVSTYDSARRMIQAGLGIGIMSELSATPYAAAMNLTCVPLLEEWAEYRLEICSRSSDLLSRPARLMLAHLIQDAHTTSS